LPARAPAAYHPGMTALNPARGGRHARHRRFRDHGLIFWFAVADVVLFVLCMVAGAISSG
jgi:hypothetical protein